VKEKKKKKKDPAGNSSHEGRKEGRRGGAHHAKKAPEERERRKLTSEHCPFTFKTEQTQQHSRHFDNCSPCTHQTCKGVIVNAKNEATKTRKEAERHQVSLSVSIAIARTYINAHTPMNAACFQKRWGKTAAGLVGSPLHVPKGAKTENQLQTDRRRGQ